MTHETVGSDKEEGEPVQRCRERRTESAGTLRETSHYPSSNPKRGDRGQQLKRGSRGCPPQLSLQMQRHNEEHGKIGARNEQLTEQAPEHQDACSKTGSGPRLIFAAVYQ